MSRFGLRSCSDGLKIADEKNIHRKSSNATSTSSKRITQQKNIKFVSNVSSNNENLIDIKIESNEIESYTCERLEKTNSESDEENFDDEIENDNDNYDEDEDDDNCRLQSSSCKKSLICSLPLDRINEIIQKLNLNKSKIEHKKDNDRIILDETLDNYDDEEDDANISKQTSPNIKNLCLYCDRKFSSHKMQLKHIEKFHCLQQDRRCSGRNAQIHQQQQPYVMSRKRKMVIEAQNFPGCNFCQKTRGHSQPVILPATELSSLFVHLTDCHTDKYFGCKICSIRFQNLSKLSQHMEIVHKSLPFAFDESSSKSKDNDVDPLISIDKLSIGERSKLSLKRQQRTQKSLNSCIAISGSVGTITSTTQCSTAISPNTSIIGAEEPILSRLGLTQNRLPNNRKGVRLRREKLLPEMLLKSEQSHTSSTNFAFGQTTSTSGSTTSTSTCSPKLRGKSIKTVSGYPTDTTSDVIFRIPTRSDILSCVFDDNFYKEVVSNVRSNLLFHLDGKIMSNSIQQLDTAVVRHAPQPQIRSTLVRSPIVVTTMNSEIHAATSLAAITAFPTLLTAEQFGGDSSTSKIRRPHTKNSWKWKWDSVKKFKLINEGGKIVKKIKHPMLGLRDLSKLDMWTQLTMRQKHELQQQQKTSTTIGDTRWHDVTSTMKTTVTDICADPSREEKQRLNDQLNYILDMRLLPHIILEQNEQAIIKLENDEFGIAPKEIVGEDCGDNFMAQTFSDESFLSMLNLFPNNEFQTTRTKMVLSGEWARPRCYLCICCGAKFEKLKSLEEHKMFRHSQILSTHYEVVGRELLNGNLLRHLFIPKKALSRYGNGSDNKLTYSGAARRLFWHKNETLIREITNNEESSDSLQSILNSCETNSPSTKNCSSSTEDCDIDTKISTTTSLQLMESTTIVSPTHSIHSCSSSSSTGVKKHLKIRTNSGMLPILNANNNTNSSNNNNHNTLGSCCSKCGRKCNGILDLYRHMLDCSGDYIWSLAKKRKYRYYCGSKKRRPCNKHSILELKRNRSKLAVKEISISNYNATEEGAITSTSFAKTKTSPRSRPSDAESIKKMLENLPPKRICKKIFPSLSKTKKCVKNMKPKLLTKHKIYNSLRKTRVRQMSQASKMLSKTKSQLKKPRKITRSTSSMSAAVNKKINNKKKKLLIKKSTGTKSTENLKSNEEPFRNNKEELLDEVDCNVKNENKNSIDTINISVTSLPNIDIEANAQLVRNTDLFSDSEKSKESPNADTVDKTVKIPCNTSELRKSSNAVHKEVPPIIIQEESTKIVNTTATTNTAVSVDHDRIIQINNKNVKRSKRISDCIAMLTGKLEEKLKTEQRILIPCDEGKDAIVIIPQISEKSTMPASQSTPCPLPPTLPKPVENIEDGKCPPKKTPKRKTISRKIIKTDITERNNLPVVTMNFENKIFDNLKPVNPSQILTTTNECQLPLTISVLNPQIVATQQSESTSTTVKTQLEPIFLQKETKQSANIIPTTTVPPMPPPILPLNTPMLLPKMPLYISLENLRQPISSSQITPLPISMSLPVPVPVPIPIENVAQVSPGTISTPVGSANVTLLPTPVTPIMTAVPTHLTTLSSLQLTTPSFNSTVSTVEPLNLSNSLKNVPKQSQDLSCSNNQRLSGIPVRRQTISGFEVHNFATFEEIEPLDLSKKTRTETTVPVTPIPPRHIETTSLLLPLKNSFNTPNGSSVLTIPPLTSEALLNKPFYSNLDLLRIPQVRNPVGQVSAAASEPLQTTVVINAIPAMTQPTKAASKKRNRPSNIQSALYSNISVGNIVEAPAVGSSSNVNKLSNAKDSTNSTNFKKESNGKNKLTLRMDEEVINHIDDAINSVINAVKASLDSEEAQKAQDMILLQNQNLKQAPVQLKITNNVNSSKKSISEFKYLTVARRNIRSKTLDCRPVALNKANVINSTFIPTNVNILPDDTTSTTTTTITTTTPQTCKNNENTKYTDTKEEFIEDSTRMPICDNVEDQSESEKVSEAEPKNESLQEKELESKFLNRCTDKNLAKQNKTKMEEENVGNTLNTNPSGDIATNLASVRDNEKIAITTVRNVEDISDKNINAVTMININLDLEHMSNNNNTSSGFHSSAQSDQQTSVMSTTTSAVSVSVSGSDTKKKQRRRRKNELAAIVADQLLESFKLDKTRRDNLMKLENLAYEKSEDLLLTGMLLMSSTKRNVTSSSNNTNPVVENNENIKRSGKFLRGNHNNVGQKQNDVSTAVSNKTKIESSANEKTLQSEKDSLEVNELVEGKQNIKRRQYRRRGKTLDNENISKLKTSLESFSIDIERQLTEYEAKNVNVFKSVVTNETSKQSCNSKNQTSTNVNKPSIILRPSILSVTLESGVNQEVSQTPPKITNDSNKTIISSRDPRLNKNIHKEGEKNSEIVNATVGKKTVLNQKNSADPEEIGDLEEDNYLTEIAKNVNEKIMSTENEEFAFKDDGFEMVNDFGMDDSNSKFSRPPTSMSVRSAPNFNDDRSNFGSICDENTNTEVMDMDLDDEMSVYTSYSQDLGRGRGRRRRRRRSILLTRKPKKRTSSREMSAEKIECILCKKVFYSANSLSKHNMTLAHVSKVSEQEYLLSKPHSNIPSITSSEDIKSFSSLGPYARRTTRRSTISKQLTQLETCCEADSSPPISTEQNSVPFLLSTIDQSLQSQGQSKTTMFTTSPVTHSTIQEDLKETEAMDSAKSSQKPTLKDQNPDDDYVGNINVNATYNDNSRLNLNPDERLFFECCNILKSAETPRINNAVTVAEECNKDTNYAYSYNHQEKSNIHSNIIRAPGNNILETAVIRPSNLRANQSQLSAQQPTNNSAYVTSQNHPMLEQQIFRDSQLINQTSCFNKPPTHDNRNARSPTYSAISHLSSVTNTTSRFKTKAAMKGYENMNIDLNQQQESRTICKLTELAEIALGNEEKPNSHNFSPIQSLTSPQVLSNLLHPHQLSKVNTESIIRTKGLGMPEYITSLPIENIKECNLQLPTEIERTKNNETRSSTSSKTIMHSSIIKAAVEEHQKSQISNKIIIPDRPFKNIGLEEKETITFQKPKAPSVNLLTEDNNSMSTGSFSDRDDYDFGSLSCDDEVSVRESNDKNQKNNSTESSSDSSRATAKTFENKSLIMGRIFKNASTKGAMKSSVNTVKVKSIGIQKDQIPIPKADLNQLFDELRGNSGVDGVMNDRVCNPSTVENMATTCLINSNNRANKQSKPQHENLKPIIPAASPIAVVSSTTAIPPTNVRKTKPRISRTKANLGGKIGKDISKLQNELGMSPDDIKKLIDEGQRKSKRRCATNRPKKLVEMWSSDEYEEFLSTKDIIALIEEKEQQEKRKKRKPSINNPLNTVDATKDKETFTAVTSNIKNIKHRNTRRLDIAVEHSENILNRNEFLPPKNTKNKKEEPVSTTANDPNARELVVSHGFESRLPQKGRGKKTKAEAIDISPTLSTNNAGRRKKRSNNSNSTNKRKRKPTQKSKWTTITKKNLRTKHKTCQYGEDKSNDDIGVNNINDDGDDDDDDDDFLISEFKIKQNNKTRGSKMKTPKIVAATSAAIATSAANLKISKISGVTQEVSSKKRGSNNNNNCKNPNIMAGSNAKSQQHIQSAGKPKRKNQSNQSPPRRKRLATEKLYYWSSSSDEDFGRINNKCNPPPDNYESGGEQYQKHGWIVGDSHKKLVTLLAIAKGNKKIDLNSGVKKNIYKKRN